MKSTFLLAALAAASAVDAHYIFNILIVNGKKIGGEYTYVRKNSNSYNPAFPSEIVDTNELRCNKGAKPSASVQTYEVKAGDKIGFKIFNNELVEHPGPGFVYMSKVPEGSSLGSYDGSGDWFKVWETGLCGKNPGSDRDWCSYGKDRLEYTIPEKIPPGEYLVRVEHIGLHEGHKKKAQFYIECFQLKVSGNGGGTPGPLAKIPGIYKQTDPGIAYDKWAAKPAAYVMPGPAAWDGN
ncbi:glycoside hydrolase [Podospora didyma]|uniref:lytic cellulose monooxygenase (C4-dehydrogenating) n=1 Tax=Podospora didyma TaxID=330526 RepID=A0AAE0NV64_9PEZI|nr:glycoside hydrolase [Podospora didyma]